MDTLPEVRATDTPQAPDGVPLAPDALVAALRAQSQRYHHKHLGQSHLNSLWRHNVPH